MPGIVCMLPGNGRLRRAATALALAAIAGAAGSARDQDQATVSCPASVRVTETSLPIDGWKGSVATVERAFERVSIYNGNSGGEEYDLAPDEQQQKARKMVLTWNLEGYRTMNLFMRCRYRDTSTVLTMDLPPKLRTCTFSADTDAKGSTVGKPTASCK
jgi:hypothetical protein